MAEGSGVAAVLAVREFWRQFRRHGVAVWSLRLLVVLYAAAALAPWLAPYGETEMDRMCYFHPPTALHWVDPEGHLHLVPFVYGTRPGAANGTYVVERSRIYPVRLFVPGAPYRLLGIVPARRHLFGVDAPGHVFLLGADSQGRDEWSRLLYGAQVSLTVGLLGIAISFSIGLLVGGISGYLGGWVDALLMRFTELLLSIPSLYLILALRNAIPMNLPSQQVYLVIVGVLAFIGWAALARVVRGMVLSIRTTDYIAAAEALGMSRLRIIVRHILPNTMSFVIIAATLSVPAYILGEVYLSYLGMGVQEPSASWGNMLHAARSTSTMESYPWLLFAPSAAIFLTVVSFNFLGDGLRDALDPRQSAGRRT